MNCRCGINTHERLCDSCLKTEFQRCEKIKRRVHRRKQSETQQIKRGVLSVLLTLNGVCYGVERKTS